LIRPNVEEFLTEVSQVYNVVIYTSQNKELTKECLQVLKKELKNFDVSMINNVRAGEKNKSL
jgi:TFIIF-interacting CTD phosphatase-like protein